MLNRLNFNYFKERLVHFNGTVVKSVVKTMHAQDAIYEHLVHNVLFPTTRYLFRGISEDAEGVRIVLS